MRGTPIVAAALACATAVLLGGCAFTVKGPDDVVVSADPVTDGVDWDAEFDAFIAEYGERPPSIPAPEADAVAIAAADADRGWEAVLRTFPNAERPSTAFAHWTTTDEQFDAASDRLQCMTAAGAVLEEGRNEAGELEYRGWSNAFDLATTVAIYSCQYLAFPVHPTVAPGRAEWRWHFADEFSIRCLEAHGAPQAPLPPIEQYLAEIDAQGYSWFEEWPENDTDVAPEADIYAACHGADINGA